MSVSILTLKTGDRVITELKEVFDGEDEDKRGICLLMEEPYLLNIEGENQQYLVEQRGMEYQIKFSKWNPYSSDTSYKIPYDCVMTISTPEKGLQSAYVNKISEKKKQYDGTADTTED
jgi:hypothetical protein